jgi:hypothetical protein
MNANSTAIAASRVPPNRATSSINRRRHFGKFRDMACLLRAGEFRSADSKPNRSSRRNMRPNRKISILAFAETRIRPAARD